MIVRCNDDNDNDNFNDNDNDNDNDKRQTTIDNEGMNEQMDDGQRAKQRSFAVN